MLVPERLTITGCLALLLFAHLTEEAGVASVIYGT